MRRPFALVPLALLLAVGCRDGEAGAPKRPAPLPKGSFSTASVGAGVGVGSAPAPTPRP